MDWAFLIDTTYHAIACWQVKDSRQESLQLQTVDRRLPSLLALTVFLLSLPWCFLDYRCRTYDAHVSTGAGLSTLHLYIASNCGLLWRSLPWREFDEGWELHLFRKGGSCPKSHLFILVVCVYMTCVWECGYACAMACMWSSDSNFGSRFSLPLWAPGTEFRFLDLCGPCHTNILMILSNIFFQFLK